MCRGDTSYTIGGEMECRDKTMCPWVGKIATLKKGKKGKGEGDPIP